MSNLSARSSPLLTALNTWGILAGTLGSAPIVQGNFQQSEIFRKPNGVFPSSKGVMGHVDGKLVL